MFNTLKINTIKIIQWNNKPFFVWKINANDLINLSSVDIRKMQNKDDKFIWIQRKIRPEKVKEIKNYLQSYDSLFPNGIILNIKKDDVINKWENFLEINKNQNVFSIIDWQHRLEWLRWENIANNFDVIVTIFIWLDTSEQAYIFSTINSTQTKVDPSLKYNLELESNLYTPRKFIWLLIESFNSFNKSPLKWELDKEETLFEWKIKFLWPNATPEEIENAIISWSWFAREIEKLLYDEKDYFNIRNLLFKNITKNRKDFLNDFYNYKKDKYILWDYYINDEVNVLFRILYNYFLVFSKNFTKDWWNKESILNKTTWFWAIMKLFKDIYLDILLKNKSDTYKIEYFTEKIFNNYLEKIAKLDWTINSNNYPWSWESSVNKLYKVFKKEIFWNN